jgi:transcription termination factor Rho
MPDTSSGILKLRKKGSGALYDLTRSLFYHEADRVEVPARLIREYQLVEGATLSGPVQEGKRGLELAAVESVCGLTPQAFQARTPYRQLIAVDPCQRFNLAATGETSMRVVDLVAPIGRGTRGLIVSPPKAGKTMLLEKLAHAIHADAPETRIIVLLIDERPEEVTFFRRAVRAADVFASSNDQDVRTHAALSELTLAHVRAELECGYDVVVLVDSLTRMGRTFNLKGSGSRRTLSGGLEAGALEIPRRFFGLARNVEDGGSVTIIATALIDTGSRMDQYIYEEFKGTGNSEIVLDRALAQAYIFPAIDLASSSTRKDHLLYDPGDARRITLLRRALAGRKPDEAMNALLNLVEKHPTNAELLQSLSV